MIKRASAAVAVSAFGLAIGAGASFAAGEEIPCGTPAVPAVYETVVVPGTPAVTHTEYLWQRTTVPVEYLWQLKVVDKEAWTETVVVKAAWTETVVVTEAYDEWVVDVKAQPAVTQVQVKWVQQGGNLVQWLPEGVEPAPDSFKWNKTRDTQTVTLTPAVEEQGHWVHHDAVTETIDHPAVTQDIDHPEESHFEEQWAAVSPGDGWVNTEQSRDLEPIVESQWSVDSPGDGWVKTEQSRVVEDQPAVPDTTKQVLVTAEIPAGEPCVEEPPVEEPPVEEPPAEEPPAEEPPAEEPPVDETPVDEEPVDEPTAPEEVPAKPEAKPAAPKPASAIPQVEAAVSPTRLAHTGTDLTLLWTGLGLVVVGAGLGAGYRKVSRES